MKGARKIGFGVFAMLTTLGALWLCLHYGDAGKVLFPSYAAFAGAVVGLVVAGNVGEWAAKRGQP